MLTASNEIAPIPTINTITAIGSYSNQRNNMGKPLMFPDHIAMVILETRRECGDGAGTYSCAQPAADRFRQMR